jgi:hypothetical protein
MHLITRLRQNTRPCFEQSEVMQLQFNTGLDHQQVTNEHLNQLEISMDHVTNILTAMLQNNPSQLNSEIKDILSKTLKAVPCTNF